MTRSASSKARSTSGMPSKSSGNTPSVNDLARDWRYDHAVVVASDASTPASAARITPQSPAVLAIGPILSIDHASGIAPARLTTPRLGLRPLTPQNADGVVIEPHVSEPSA